VQVPAQPVDAARPLVDQVLPVVDQQAQLPRRAVQPGDRKVLRVAEPGPGHRQGVDRVGLAVAAGCVPGVRHQLGRHPHDPLAGGERIGLQPARQVPTVLDRPRAFAAEPARPAHQFEMIGRRRGRGRLRAQLPPGLVDHHDRVRALVRVDPESHHGPVTFHFNQWRRRDRSAGTPHVRAAAESMVATRGRQVMSQPPGRGEA
jgi:hypothetical protein